MGPMRVMRVMRAMRMMRAMVMRLTAPKMPVGIPEQGCVCVVGKVGRVMGVNSARCTKDSAGHHDSEAANNLTW